MVRRDEIISAFTLSQVVVLTWRLGLSVRGAVTTCRLPAVLARAVDQEHPSPDRSRQAAGFTGNPVDAVSVT